MGAYPFAIALLTAILVGYLGYQVVVLPGILRDRAKARVDEYMRPPTLEELAGQGQKQKKKGINPLLLSAGAAVVALFLKLPFTLALVAGVAGYVLPRYLQRRRERKERNEIEKELPAALDRLAAMISISSDPRGILDAVADTLAVRGETPLSRELRHTAADIGQRGTEAALLDLEQRAVTPSLRTVAFALRIFTRTGGQFAPLLASAAARLRTIIEGRMLARAKASSARQTAIILPLILGGTLLLCLRDPDVRAFYASPVGQVVLLGGLGSMAFGWYMIEAMLEDIV